MVSGNVLECDIGSQYDNSSRMLLIHLENSSDWLNLQLTDISICTSTSVLSLVYKAGYLTRTPGVVT